MPSLPPPAVPAGDAAAVRRLAHPLRARLLARLREDGPATATRLAAALGTNSGATSYHLRRLEGVQLVTDSGAGRGRERVWRAQARRSWTAGDLEDDEDSQAALAWLERDYLRHFADRAERWLDVAPTWPVGWVELLGLRDGLALVSKEQLGAMRAEIDEVVQRYRRVGQGNPQARRVAVYTYCYPLDLTSGPGGPEPPRAARRPTP